MFAVSLPDLSSILLTMLPAAVKTGWVDARTTAIQGLWRFTPPLTVRQLIRAVHHAERTAIGEPSIEDSIGANAESWQLPARAYQRSNGGNRRRVARFRPIALSEAEAAVVPAQMNGGNRMERVALLPTAVTIPGAATLLGLSNRDVVTLLRVGNLSATRRGRHLYIERDAIESFRHRG